MKALILTEGGRRIGFGHIARCRALQEALRARGVDVSLVVNGDSSVKEQFFNDSLRILNWLKGKALLAKLMKQKDIVIIDSYLAPMRFYQNISKAIPSPVYLDDFMRLSYPPGIVVGGAIGAEKFHDQREMTHRYLLGAKYALLRRGFWNIPQRKVRSQIRDVLITCGGMDHFDFIQKLLLLLTKKFPLWKFHAITTQTRNGSKNRPRIANSKLYSHLSSSQMCELMRRCDVAISGGGQTTHELAACGVPTIGICFASNQRLNLRGWQRCGFLKNAGPCNRPGVTRRIELLLKDLSYQERCRMSLIGQRLIDGNGAVRVAEEIVASPIVLSRMILKDCRQVFEWANDPEVRAVSFNPEPILWPHHRVWFKAKVQDKSCIFYKVHWFDRPIGQVRFDRSGHKATISVSLIREYRRKGLGAPTIKLASARLFSNTHVREITAFVKLNNKVSRKVFEKAGFQRDTVSSIHGRRAQVLRLKRIGHG